MLCTPSVLNDRFVYIKSEKQQHSCIQGWPDYSSDARTCFRASELNERLTSAYASTTVLFPSFVYLCQCFAVSSLCLCVQALKPRSSEPSSIKRIVRTQQCSSIKLLIICNIIQMIMLSLWQLAEECVVMHDLSCILCTWVFLNKYKASAITASLSRDLAVFIEFQAG